MTKMPDQWRCDSCGRVTTAQYRVEGSPLIMPMAHYSDWASLRLAAESERHEYFGEAATRVAREVEKALKDLQCSLELPDPVCPYSTTKVDLCPDCYGTVLRWLHGEKLPRREPEGQPEMPLRHEPSVLEWLWKRLKGTPKDREWV